mmetsp:Transcript_6788/g.13701  ORF Transcript_6788/g.13701 Transcript_6788/m.13701 type:complete len:331 (+) Transcript_6788:309-1301(+)
MLKRMSFHSHDGLDPEDRTPVRRELAERMHEFLQLSRHDLPLGDERERVQSAVVPAAALPMAMCVALAGAVVAAVTMAVAAKSAAAMAATCAVALPIACAATLVTKAAAVRGPALVDELRLLHDVFVDEIANVVRPQVAELLHPHPALDGAQDLRELVDLSDAVPDRDGLFRADQVQLVQDDFVREHNLLVSLVDLALFHCVIKSAQKVLRVGQGDDRVEPQVLSKIGGRHKGPNNRHRVGHACGLDHDLVDLAPGLDVVQNLHEPQHQVAPDRAAHTPIIHEHDLLRHRKLLLREQRIVDGDLAELVLDDGDFLLPLLSEDVVEKRGLA